MPALFLVLGKIKGRTMRMGGLFSLRFRDLRIHGGPAASTAVIGAKRPTTKSVGVSPRPARRRRILSIAVAVLACAIGSGCSRKPHATHETESHAPEPPPPTPDTTPIPVLRTPAGLVLGVEGTPAPPEPTPGADQPLEVVTPPPGA